MTKAITAQALRKVYPGNPPVEALASIDLEIQDNEFFTLLGPSGCGKTTLLRLIAGFEHPTSGRLDMFGESLLALPPYKRPINTVFQNYALFPHMTVAENIGFGLQMLGTSKSTIKSTVAEMMELVQMTAMADRQTSQISGGQQQRVALARALAPRPKILLLDEPLSALDFKLRKKMQLELKRLQTETGITFIFVTHDQEEALTMSDRIAVMSNGAVRQVGRPREIYDRPADRFVADFIGDTNFLSAEVIGHEGETARLRLPSGKMVGAHANETRSGQVTVALRPEHAQLTSEADGLLTGQLRDVVYFGTDTHFHVGLDEGSEFILRQQNGPAVAHPYVTGDRVGVTFPDGAAQVLRD